MVQQISPLRVRRIVTGHDAAGNAVVVEDGIAPRFHDFASIPGMSETLVWTTAAGGVTQAQPTDPTPAVASMVPGLGETHLHIVAFPPDAVFESPDFDPDKAAREQAEAQPGLAERFEPDAPGMHTTDTVDYGIVLEGEITLELDDGATTVVRRGDVVIQNGTRHAWRNLSAETAVLAFFNVGSTRPS